MDGRSERFILSSRVLLFGFGSFTRFHYMGWAFDDKYHIHKELGGEFMHFTMVK